MKRRMLSLALAAALGLLCAACAPAGQGAETGAPEDLPAESTAQAEYDFNGETLDEYTESLTGFEGLPWGYVLPQETSDALNTGENETISLTTMEQFAGLTFRAERIFSDASGIPGLEKGQKALTMGQYTRTGYLRPDDPEGRTAAAVADFNQTLAYLTQLYGSPASCTLSRADGESLEELTAPLTAEQYGAEGTGSCTAVWSGLENGRIMLRLDAAYGLSLMVTFTPDIAVLQGTGRTEESSAEGGVPVELTSEACPGFGGLNWGASGGELFPGGTVPEPATKEFQLNGWPCTAYYSFDEDGRLWSGYYLFQQESADDTIRVYREVVQAMTGAYGAPDELYTRGSNGRQIPAPTIEDVEAGRSEACLDGWGGLDDGGGGRVNAGVQLQNNQIYLWFYLSRVGGPPAA